MQTESRIVLRRAEYDIYNLALLDEELRALEPGSAAVDFVNVTYIDSTAIGRLIHALKELRLRDPQSTIALENVAPSIRRIFDIAALSNVFVIR